jgi:hypothetical protein
MSKSTPALSANPLQVVRSLPITLIALDKIAPPRGTPEDQIFLSKYTAFLRGKAPIHESRAKLSTIRNGLWRRTNGRYALAGEHPPAENIQLIKEMIQLGNRPTLFVYDNPNKEDSKRYVCTDDTATHSAYEELGISVVPISLMGKPKDIEESCISIRAYPRGATDQVHLIEGFAPTTHKFVPSILGSRELTTTESLEKLLEEIGRTKTALRFFHKPGAVKFHYHHTLYSVLLRAEENISSIKMLVEAGKVLVAASLLRTLHELVLTFYIDWLSPGQTYKYLQLASVMSEKDWEKSCNKTMQEQISAGLPKKDALNIRDAQMRGYRLCSVVGNKARMFPLGEKYQQDIYSFLSDILHHDFSMDARYAHTLDHGDEAVYNADAAGSIRHIADLLISSMITRILSDIGISSPPELQARAE